MKIKISSLLLFLAGCIMVSCSQKENGGSPGNSGGKAIYLKMKTGTMVRSDEPSQTGETATLYTALIYFMDGSNVVHDVLTVGNNGQDITLAQLEAGYRAEGITSTVTQVYIVGNYNSTDSDNNAPTFPMEDGTTLEEIQAVVLNIEQVSHGSLRGGITSENLITVMDGLEDLVLYTDNPGGWNGDETPEDSDYYVEVSLTPVVARIEIEQITYTGNLLAFTLNGIFINYYYQNMPLSLDPDGFPYTNNGSDVAAYTIDSTTFAYHPYMTLYDLPGETVAPTGSATFTPETTPDGVWAYQVFGNSSPVPHIVLRLTGVTYSGGTFVQERYVTFTGFIDQGGNPITTFQRNTIYKITNLEFDNSNLEPLPEPETINVWVHVTVEPWDTVIVTPTL